MSSAKENKKTGLKRTLIEWGVIGAIAALLYITGLHTQVIGTLQRGMLYTGLFNADTSEISTTNGPFLSDKDFSFAMETDENETISLNDFKGDVVFINVWASWCPPCIAEMPTIETLHENVSGKDNIRFILLSLDQETQEATEFIQNQKIDIPYYFPASRLPSQFNSDYLPTTYIISKKGQVVYRKEGIADYSSLNFAQWMIELANE